MIWILLSVLLVSGIGYGQDLYELNRSEFEFGEFYGDRDNRLLVDEYNAFLPEISYVSKPDAIGSCGGVNREQHGKIASPNYPTEYPADINCTWILQVEEGKLMNLKFTYMDVEVDPPDCPFDGVVLMDYGKIAKPDDFDSIVARGIMDSISVPPTVLGEIKYCGNGTDKSIKSISNTVFVYFYSDFSSNGGGFVLEWDTIETPDDEYDCNFEKGICPGWVNINTQEDDFDWDIGQGETMVDGTGPSLDHTLQDPDGKYVYMQAVLQKDNETAILSSPEILFKPSEELMCLEFWYHMSGVNVNTLAVGLGIGKTRKVQWMARGDQGSQWIRQTIEIQKIVDPFRLMFVGITGNGDAGDIAIDDIKLHRVGCTQTDDAGVETTTAFDYYYGTTDTIPDYFDTTTDSYTTEATTDQTTEDVTTDQTTTVETTDEITTEVTTEAEVTTAEQTTVESTTAQQTTVEMTTEPTTFEQTTEYFTTEEETTYAEETTIATTSTRTTTLPPKTTSSTTTTEVPSTTMSSTTHSTTTATVETPSTPAKHVEIFTKPQTTMESVTTEELTTENMFVEVTTTSSETTEESKYIPQKYVTMKAILESTNKSITVGPEPSEETTSSAISNARYSTLATVVSLSIAILVNALVL